MENLFNPAQENHALSPLLSQQILANQNRLDSEDTLVLNKTLQQLFEEQVAKTPNNIALVYEDLSLTYQELNENANQLAHYLRSFGVKPETLVAICIERSFDLVIGIFAILKAGGAYIPLDPAHPIERLTFVLNDSQTSFLVTQSHIKAKLADFQGQSILLDQCRDEMIHHAIDNPPCVTQPENLAYVMYTSGSIGHPKGVLIEHISIVNTLITLERLFPLHEHDAFLFKTNHSFDVSLTELFGFIFQGGKLVILKPGDELDLSKILTAIEKNKITHINFAPSIWQSLIAMLKEEDYPKLRQLKYLFVGGEAISKHLVEQTKKILANSVAFENVYGPTEASVWASHFDLMKNTIESNNTPIGKALSQHIRLSLLDHDLKLVPVGVPGELHIGGFGVSRGYLNRKELTAQKFIQNPFHPDHHAKLYKTGDLCRYLPDGNIEYIGRMDDQVKIHGFRIELGEIEARLALHQAIDQVVVVAREDRMHEKRLVAYYRLKKNEQILDTQALQEHLGKYLPEYMVPSYFIKLDIFPLNANGKLDRKSLPAPEYSKNTHGSLPKSDLEREIAKIWSQVLDVIEIKMDDNFFDLGGHSLSVARLLHKLRQLTRKNVSSKFIYDHPTIHQLIPALNQINEPNPIREASQVMHQNAVPASDSQLNMWLSKFANTETQGNYVYERKRIKGHVNVKALYFAFKCVFKKHPLFYSHFHKYKPVIYFKKTLEFTINEKDLKNESAQEKEAILALSLDQLKKSILQKTTPPLIMVNLFYLDHHESELQFCINHIISDEISIDIILSDLSNYYLDYALDQHYREEILPEMHFLDHIKEEKQLMQHHTDKKIQFWKDYFNDVPLIKLDQLDIVDENNDLVTVRKFPKGLIQHLRLICHANRINLYDYLQAVSAKSFMTYLDIKKPIKACLIQSLRDKDAYAKTVGPFINGTFIKFNMNETDDNFKLAQKVQDEKINVMPYQSCPYAMRLSCAYTKYWPKSFFISFLRLLMKPINKILSKIQLDEKYNLFFLTLALTKKTMENDLLFFINIMNKFLLKNNMPSHHGHHSSLFGFDVDNIPFSADKTLFLKNAFLIEMTLDHHQDPIIIINSRLKPEARESIADMIFDHFEKDAQMNREECDMVS